MDLSLYIHYPFCVAKCDYCDFVSAPGTPDLRRKYVRLLVEELKLRRELVPEKVSIESIYFGGGTPSLMDPDEAALLLDAVRDCGDTEGAEITLETNPGTVDRRNLEAFRQAGINRISLGVQALDDRLLRRLGRVHTAAEAEAAFFAARDAGFANIGLDLMLALPGETPGSRLSELRRATALRPEHLSVYGLTVEEGTPFHHLQERGELQVPDADAAAAAYEEAVETFTAAGYDRYEISNFSLPGFESRHNSRYWLRRSYLGIGLAAHSFLREGSGLRWRNTDDHAAYAAAVSAGTLEQLELERLTPEEAAAEFFFLGLRMLEGVDLDDFAREFPEKREALETVERLIARKLLLREGSRVRLAPEAVLVSNQVLAEFI